MAIDRIPGVGPANSDIAAAVAAPSAATIATAVAAPSAATIAAAVAAPSAATIAAAVAAPSSATIATAVAAAVPTLTQINNSVATNSSAPFGGTWVNVAVTSPNGVNGITFSSLSGYRYYRLYVTCENMSATNRLAIRFNGDSTTSYNAFHYAPANGNSIKGNTNGLITSSANGPKGALIDIPSANSTSTDKLYFCTAAGDTVVGITSASGVWGNTAAITSITVYDAQGQTGNWYARLVGTN